MRGIENIAHEDGPDDGHRNFSVSRRLNRIEVEAVANGMIIFSLKRINFVTNFSLKKTPKDLNYSTLVRLQLSTEFQTS